MAHVLKHWLAGVLGIGSLSFWVACSDGGESASSVTGVSPGGNIGAPLVFSLDSDSSVSFLQYTGLVFAASEGTSQGDKLDGTEQNDVIRGLSGSDEIRGLAGRDYLLGNQGNDVLRGNQGADVLRGGKDNDLLFGGQDDDWLYGDAGDDQIFGNLGSDHLLGGGGNDFLDGGAGNDTYYFKIGDGQDRIHDLGDGSDRIVCLGFPRNSAVIGKMGDRLSIRFPTGDSLVIENHSAIEVIDCRGTDGGFSDNAGPKRL